MNVWNMTVVTWTDEDTGKVYLEFVSKRNVEDFCKEYAIKDAKKVNLGEVRTVGLDIKYYSVYFKDGKYSHVEKRKPFKLCLDSEFEVERNPTRNHFCLKKISESLHEVYVWAETEEEAIFIAGVEYKKACYSRIWEELEIGKYELIWTR